MKRFRSTLFVVMIFLAGCGLILYPTVSDYWNTRHQSRAIAGYEAGLESLEEEDYTELLKAAREYNQKLVRKGNRFHPSEKEDAYYHSLLSIENSDVMAALEIPAIGAYLPVYHGVDESVLQAGIGHIEGSSLPVGGSSSHCALSGHRGLPSSTLFSNLNQVKEGDRFRIYTLNETLTYEVDQIQVVKPEEVDSLDIEEGRDYCTLITCTPYSINTHRLLVRGVRVEETAEEDGLLPAEKSLAAQSPAQRVIGHLEPAVRLSLAAIPVLFILLVILLIRSWSGAKKPDEAE